jgi:soluble lytic murein transglycosylase-like protein
MRYHVPTLLLIFTVILPSFHVQNNAQARIYRKVDSEGNITFYNRKPVQRSHVKKIPSTEFDSLINSIAGRENIDPYLIKCIVKTESNFNPDAVSVAGAMGLMQLMQATADIYDVSDPFDPEENLDAGIRHFKMLMNYFQNDIALSLAAYHAGLGRVKRNMRVPRIKSTMAYVKKIMRLYNGSDVQEQKIKQLYTRIDKEGDIIIYSK